MISSSPYYSLHSFGILGPVAVLYTVASNLWFRLLSMPIQPLPCSLKSSNTPENRVAIITGSNTGIGYETARSLAVDHGLHVILACRSRDKAQRAVQQIQAEGGKADFGLLDLASFGSIREFCKTIKPRFPKIHILINNAGRNTSGTSQDNLDLLFQSNFLGHYLLTSLLLKDGVLVDDARIVNLSSVMHHYCGGADIESMDFWKQLAQSDQQDTYSLSKLAALLFSIELNRRFPRIRSIAVNPGAVNSDIWRDFPRILIPIFSLIYLNNRQGSRTSVAATLGDFDDSVLYLQPYWLPSTSQAPFPALEMLGPYQGHCLTQPRLPADGGSVAAEALWEASAEITKATWPGDKEQ